MKTEKHSTSVSQNSSRTEIVKSLIEEFQNKEFREGYTEDFINAKIATQIKVLREQENWSQKELATLTEMAQERVCVLEDVDYDSWTLKILRRFARAFGLVADFDFKEYGEFLADFQNFGREKLQKRSFEKDPLLLKTKLEEFEADNGEIRIPEIKIRGALGGVKTKGKKS
jgi:predicted XRE-type DNA-binding protein